MDPVTFVILGVVTVSAILAKCLTYVVERVAELNTGYELREVYVPIGS